jgi:hypothetical protein
MSAGFIVAISATGRQSPSLPDEYANGNDVGLGGEDAQTGLRYSDAKNGRSSRFL